MDTHLKEKYPCFFVLDVEKTYHKKLHEFVEIPPKLWYNN